MNGVFNLILTVNDDKKYQIQKVQVVDHRAQGHFENGIGYNTDKINACFLTSKIFWKLANREWSVTTQLKRDNLNLLA